MAAYVSVPRDLTRVKTKIFFNLTKRQLICFGGGALIGIPAFFLLKSVTNVSLASLGMILIMMPMFFLGLYEKNGQPAEVLVKQFITAKFIRPRVRPYQTDNYYSALMRQAAAEEEADLIVKKSAQKHRKTRKGKEKAAAAEAYKKRAEAG